MHRSDQHFFREYECISASFSTRTSFCDIYNVISGNMRGFIHMANYYYLERNPKIWKSCLNGRFFPLKAIIFRVKMRHNTQKF